MKNCQPLQIDRGVYILRNFEIKIVQNTKKTKQIKSRIPSNTQTSVTLSYK